MPDYAKSLNKSQLEAATSQAKATLVIAGAGSGKTRTIVYRLAWLVEQGIKPEEILLLTFTRKAAGEMLARAGNLLETDGLGQVSGGTFHAFAYGALRRWKPGWLAGRNFTLLDQSDINKIIGDCKTHLGVGKKDYSFPKAPLIASILSKARNKELSITEVLQRDSFHLLPHSDALTEIGKAYINYKREFALLDYDDLLFELENVFKENETASQYLCSSYKHILVDEYQDTNLVQARLIKCLAGDLKTSKVMVVGDDAQAIYGFRGSNVNNILQFPSLFPDTHIVRLEENYRSTQPILDVANSILEHAEHSFEKRLFTQRQNGEPVKLIMPLSDSSQAQIVVSRIQELLCKHLPHEIAVLFRSGFHSYPLEAALRKAGINFRKYGGLRLVEAAHIKDLMAYAKLVINPADQLAFNRLALMCKGVGSKNADRLYKIMLEGNYEKFFKAFNRFPELLEDLRLVDGLRAQYNSPATFFEKILDHYRNRIEALYPEDWPKRLQGLEELILMAQTYEDLELFVADLTLDSPEEENSAENSITLSTIHSAKGLEWNAVIVIDLVEDRFPSRHAQAHPDEFEEERRLFYVACTRARQSLDLLAPVSIFSKTEHAHTRVSQSPFLREIPPSLLECFQEKYEGYLARKSLEQPKFGLRGSSPKIQQAVSGEMPAGRKISSEKMGYCRHKLFGRGKIIKFIDEEKVQVNFPGFGLKVILKPYLAMEE